MAQIELFIANIQASEIFENLANVLAIDFWSEKTIKITYQFTGGIITGSISCKGKELISNTNFLDLINNLQEKTYLEPDYILVDYESGGNHRFLSFKPTKDNQGINDRLGYIITFEEKDPALANIEYKDQTLAALHDKFNLTNKFQIIKTYLTKEEQQLINARENTLSALQTASKNLTVVTSKQIDKWNDKIIELQDTLERKHQEKETKLESNFEGKETKLNNEREKFNAEKAKFDARANTVVRRSLLDEIKELIKQNSETKTSNTTLKKRKPILLACMILIIVALCGQAVFISLFIKSNNDYFLLFPVASFSIILISTFIYYIRWENIWFKRHADKEFSNKKFETDMLRSSWIVEMLLEWNDKKEIPIPEQLISSLTVNLFEDNNQLTPLTHPIEDILKTAGKFKKLKFGRQGFEMEQASKETTD